MDDASGIEQRGAVRLLLQGDQLTFDTDPDRGAGHHAVVAITSVRRRLERGGLTEASLETAIAEVEDLIMPVLRSLPSTRMLRAAGSELEKVLHLLSPDGSTAISLEEIEGAFNQLADYAAGLPVAWQHKSAPNDVALALLVLREVMHHGNFRSVSL